MSYAPTRESRRERSKRGVLRHFASKGLAELAPVTERLQSSRERLIRKPEMIEAHHATLEAYMGKTVYALHHRLAEIEHAAEVRRLQLMRIGHLIGQQALPSSVRIERDSEMSQRATRTILTLPAYETRREGILIVEEAWSVEKRNIPRPPGARHFEIYRNEKATGLDAPLPTKELAYELTAHEKIADDGSLIFDCRIELPATGQMDGSYIPPAEDYPYVAYDILLRALEHTVGPLSKQIG